MTMQFDKAGGVVGDEVRVAQALHDHLKQTYIDGVIVALRHATITISRGKRAAQIQVLAANSARGDKRFLVSLRRNETFHMRPAPDDMQTMVDLVHKMVGDIQVG